MNPDGTGNGTGAVFYNKNSTGELAFLDNIVGIFHVMRISALLNYGHAVLAAEIAYMGLGLTLTMDSCIKRITHSKHWFTT